MLKLTDLRKTTRRTRSGDGRTLHPHFLRDRSLAPRIEIAIKYLESMLGRPRRELDQEVIVQLFGDHKLARCMVACLADSYHHRCQTFAELLPAPQVEVLGSSGITNPSQLRLWLFHQANNGLSGFVGSTEYASFLSSASNQLGMTSEQIETLRSLDSPEHAILARTGPKPTADDVIARFNYQSVAAILANAPIVRISLASIPRDAQTIRELCASANVRAELAAHELILHGQQDALEGWSRHGARLVRLFAMLLACGLPAHAGEAIIAAPDGSQWHFRLTPEIFAYLGLRGSEADADFSAADLLACWRAQDTLIADYASLRRAGAQDGWILRRAPGPLILDGAILPTLFGASRDRQRVWLVLAPRTSLGAARLAALASRIPILTLRMTPDAPSQQQVSQPTPGLLTLAYTNRGAIAQLPTLLAQTVGTAEQRGKAQQLEALFEEAYHAGVLTEQQISNHLACALEELPTLLARSEALTLARDYHTQYIEGFGLCSVQTLMRARAVVRDIATHSHVESTIQTLRVLGRRLREVTGASEGIECLIAYLGAA